MTDTITLDDKGYVVWRGPGGTRSISPGDDISDLPTDVQAAVAALRTDEALAAYAAYVAAAAPEPPSNRTANVKAECKRRIYAVASAEAQMNIIGAQAAGSFDAIQEAAYLASVQWIADMRAACDAIIGDQDLNPYDDMNWPLCPHEVAALAGSF